MKKLESYTVWYYTNYGIAITIIKANSFNNCFDRLANKYKKSCWSIVNNSTYETLEVEILNDWKDTLFLNN